MYFRPTLFSRLALAAAVSFTVACDETPMPEGDPDEVVDPEPEPEPDRCGPERCNGLDDDCDGRTDEGPDGQDLRVACYDGPLGTEGVGACAAGTAACVDGALGPCQGARAPRPEACNAADDDCDGALDEGLELGPCSAGEGACHAEGALRCEQGLVSCDAEPGAPGVEDCNGVDDDCDGLIDEVAACQAPECGNGRVEEGEECDGGAICRNDCTFAARPEQERNDSIDRANDVGLYRRIQGRTGPEFFCGLPDVDYFTFTVDEPVSLDLRCRRPDVQGRCLYGRSDYVCASLSISGDGVDARVPTVSDDGRACPSLEAGLNPDLQRLEPGVYTLRVEHEAMSCREQAGWHELYWYIDLEFGPPAPAP